MGLASASCQSRSLPAVVDGAREVDPRVGCRSDRTAFLRASPDPGAVDHGASPWVDSRAVVWSAQLISLPGTRNVIYSTRMTFRS